jgi:ketosteroid isomerase-like protein
MSVIEQRLATLEAKVRDLEAAQAIRATLSQYAVAVDEKRPERLRTLFAADAVVRIPAWNVDVAGIDAVMAFYDTYWNRFDRPRRYFANEDLRIAGSDATCFMYWHVTQERNGLPVLGWGTYDWQLRQLDGAWRIASVLITILAMTTLAAGWGGANRFTDA